MSGPYYWRWLGGDNWAVGFNDPMNDWVQVSRHTSESGADQFTRSLNAGLSVHPEHPAFVGSLSTPPPPPAPAPLAPLVRLETGFWVDPRYVARITSQPDGGEGAIVKLTMNDGFMTSWRVDDMNPTAAADAIAAQINAARLGGGRDGASGQEKLPAKHGTAKNPGPLAVACPYCNAKPGQGCEGGQANHYHLDRYTKADSGADS